MHNQHQIVNVWMGRGVESQWKVASAGPTQNGINVYKIAIVNFGVEPLPAQVDLPVDSPYLGSGEGTTSFLMNGKARFKFVVHFIDPPCNV